MLSRDADVEDALQDTFCKIWTRALSFEGEEHAEAYTVTAMRNACIDTTRRHDSISETVPIERCEADIEDTDEEAERRELYERVISMSFIKEMGIGFVGVTNGNTQPRFAMGRSWEIFIMDLVSFGYKPAEWGPRFDLGFGLNFKRLNSSSGLMFKNSGEHLPIQ